MNTAYQSGSLPSLHMAASEVLWHSTETSTPVLQQYNTAGVVLLWPKAESANVVSPRFNTAGAKLSLLKMENTEVVMHQFNENKVITLWSEHWVPSEPHQELMPWVGWFRPVSARNWLWEWAWPEEDWMHP
ncbi:MAG: hypothetical protein WC464_05285 [Bdellovibrionales bacterium]